MGRKTSGTFSPSSRPQLWLRLGACVALTLAIVSCGKKDEAAPAPGAATPGVPASAGATPAVPVVKLSVNELLQRAKTAEKEQRMVAPANDNAMDYYLQIIAQEPSNAQATQALVDLFPMAASSAESSITQKNVAEAERIIGMLDKSSPGSYTVTTLRAKLDTQRAAGERAETEKLAEDQRRLELLQQQAAAAQAAQAPATPAPAAASPAATTPPAVADEPSPATTEPAPATSASTTPAAPAPATASPDPSPSTTGGQTREVRLVRQVPPAFPPEAVRKRQSGWVEVRITVSPQGSVTGAEVVRAQPSRVFDRAALAAVRQWRFEPALRNGQPIAAQRTQRIEFKL